MKLISKISPALQGLVLFCGSGVAFAADTPPKPDNTAVNERDRKDNAVTADDQGKLGTQDDTELTRLIRKEIVKQKGLSIYAKNIKIISNQGKVTLRGPVKTTEDRDAIIRIASQLAGDTQKVHSEIEIVNK